jgi:pentatricopeptide repeat protein
MHKLYTWHVQNTFRHYSSTFPASIIKVLPNIATSDSPSRLFGLHVGRLIEQNKKQEALKLFQQYPNPPPVLYNAIISKLTRSGNKQDSLLLVEEALAKDIVPDDGNLIQLMVESAHDLQLVKKLYFDLKRHRRILNKDIHAHYLAAFYQNKQYEQVLRLYYEWDSSMLNTHSYSVVIKSAFELKQYSLVESIMERMKKENVLVNDHLLTVLLSRYHFIGEFQRAVDVFYEFKDSVVRIDVQSVTSVIASLSKLNRVQEAVALAKTQPLKTTQQCNTLIRMYADHGMFEEAFGCLKQMVDTKIPISSNTMQILCIHASQCDQRTFQIFLKTFDMLEKMKIFNSDAALLRDVIRGCRNCGMLSEMKEVYQKLMGIKQKGEEEIFHEATQIVVLSLLDAEWSFQEGDSMMLKLRQDGFKFDEYFYKGAIKKYQKMNANSRVDKIKKWLDDMHKKI